MAGPVTQRRPTFFWQAALILLPVAVLAVLGWFSLRQDQLLAEHDAKERAQSVADELLPKIWNELNPTTSDETNHPSFQVDENGQLIFPPPFDRVPTPQPFDLAKLNADQARLWQQLQVAASGGTNFEARVQDCKDFIASEPSENFAAQANYDLGLLLVKQGKISEAAETFDLVARKYPDAMTESGLPLQPLAQMKLFEIEPREKRLPYTFFGSTVGHAINRMAAPAYPADKLEHFISIDSLCSNLVYRPTPLTPYLLAELESMVGFDPRQEVTTGSVQAPRSVATHKPPQETEAFATQEAARKWRNIWAQHELSRKLFSFAQPDLRANTGSLSLSVTNEPATVMSAVSQFHLSIPPDATEWPTAGLFWIHFPAREVYTETKSWLQEHSGVNGRYQEVENRWLALPSDAEGTNRWYFCRNESEIGSKMIGLTGNGKPLPDFFGIGIEIAGKKILANAPDLRMWRYNYYVSKGAGQEKKEYLEQLATNVLASASKSDAGADLLKVNVYLTSPSALYRRQQARVFWFGSLIAVSTGAALIGLLAAWRAFRRQWQLSEMKSNFVSSVSHELRAPIASVRLMAENLEREKIPELQRQKEYFRFIVQECRRLSSLIENVLDFSRIEQGRKQYEFEPTDMIALVEQTVKLMQPCAAEKGVCLELETFNFQPSTSDLELNVDGRAIQQALVNLIDNAIKHSPQGGLVTVGFANQTASGDAANLRPSTFNLFVRDHGPGIPPKEQEKIFERFYRRGSELRRETQGVGIGLSIVKHIIEAHGGRVRVQSEVGQGSWFTIELPVANRKDAETQR